MKYFLIAGEKSGDLHASNLVSKLRKMDPKSEFYGYGGDRMEDSGMELLGHYSEVAFMGFVEVLINLQVIRQRMVDCQEQMLRLQPDLVILIDYPGFNLRMAKFAKENNFQVTYYIAPKVWAWNEGRVKKIRKYVDQLLCILPFEQAYFAERGVSAEYVGNSVVEAINDHSDVPIDRSDEAKVVACLPGSRAQEVTSSLDLISAVAKENPNIFFMVAAVNNLPYDLYAVARSVSNIEVLEERTYDILRSADAAIVVSGTATLETALLKVPQVVIYKASRITYLIAKWLVKIKYISLVNLINDEPTVKEMIQQDFTVQKVNSELQRLLLDNDYRMQVTEGYGRLVKKIGQKKASENAAAAILKRVGN